MQFDGGRVADVAIVAAELATNLIKHADDGALLLRPLRYEELRRGGADLDRQRAGDGGPRPLRPRRALHRRHARHRSRRDRTPGQPPRRLLAARPGGTVLAVQIWPGEAAGAAGLGRRAGPAAHGGDREWGRVRRTAGGPDDGRCWSATGSGTARWPPPPPPRRSAPSTPPRPAGPGAGRRAPAPGRCRTPAEPRSRSPNSIRPPPRCAMRGWATSPAASPAGTAPAAGLVSLPGIAGHQRRSVREYDYPLGAGALLVMHFRRGGRPLADWDDYPGLLGHSPVVIAATVLRDAAVRRDDACVVVVPAEE